MAIVPYSFVVPALNEAEGISQLLEQLRERFPSAELIVVDGGSSDRTCDLARPLCDKLIESAPGRALQMNVGAQSASGNYLLFLHADTLPGLNEPELQSHLVTNPAWGFCRVSLAGTEPAFRIISGFINLRSRVTRVATGDQMLFIQRQLLQQAGGFDEIPLMEDVAFSKRMRKRAPPLLIKEPVTTSSRRWREAGVLRTILKMWALRFAYFIGVSPQHLWHYYYGDD
ncbi:MAG: TIGR04283 family arsenosugar biosynthesis glycosyltransferase [Halioglobus sp.]